LDPERVDELEDGMLRVEDVGQVLMSAFASLEKPVHFGGKTPEAEAADDSNFERFRAFDHGLESFRAEGDTLKEHFSQVATYVLLRLLPCSDDLVGFLP
jgi:hypothetical protein